MLNREEKSWGLRGKSPDLVPYLLVVMMVPLCCYSTWLACSSGLLEAVEKSADKGASSWPYTSTLLLLSGVGEWYLRITRRRWEIRGESVVFAEQPAGD